MIFLIILQIWLVKFITLILTIYTQTKIQIEKNDHQGRS
jgi:hypothetical protein